MINKNYKQKGRERNNRFNKNDRYSSNTYHQSSEVNKKIKINPSYKEFLICSNNSNEFYNDLRHNFKVLFPAIFINLLTIVVLFKTLSLFIAFAFSLSVVLLFSFVFYIYREDVKLHLEKLKKPFFSYKKCKKFKESISIKELKFISKKIENEKEKLYFNKVLDYKYKKSKKEQVEAKVKFLVLRKRSVEEVSKSEKSIIDEHKKNIVLESVVEDFENELTIENS